jgi:hypothetical protein
VARAVEAGSADSALRRNLFALAQWQAERVNAGVRRQLLSMEDQMADALAFTGRRE